MVRLTNKQVVEIERSREERAPEFAKQVRERSRKKTTGKLNIVDKVVHTRPAAEVVASRDLGKPEKRRYTRPSALPGIPDLPGYHMEYVRRDQGKTGDLVNLRMHLRSQWEIVRASEIKEQHLPTVSLTGHGDCIGNEDTVLMKLPEDLWADRQSQINEKRDERTRAVNSKVPNIENAHPSMPVTVETNTVSHERPQVRVKERTAHVASD